ncbi:MAG TPA: hypothetical protein O0X70_03550 [Methanocorpusculum sp.]|nr:hypothetical protein [Methanocorpusculum sp.]
MGSEVYQAQVIKAFFETLTGTDRSLMRIKMCVVSLAKLRGETPEKFSFLMDQLQKSYEKKTISMDIIDYMADAANSLESWQSQTAFGVTNPVKADDFSGFSLDSL